MSVLNDVKELQVHVSDGTVTARTRIEEKTSPPNLIRGFPTFELFFSISPPSVRTYRATGRRVAAAA